MESGPTAFSGLIRLKAASRSVRLGMSLYTQLFAIYPIIYPIDHHSPFMVKLYPSKYKHGLLPDIIYLLYYQLYC